MDSNRFKSIILPMTAKLMQFAFSILHEVNDAEDAVQEVLLRLWKMRDHLDKYQSKEALAMKITKNLCLDRIKAKKPVYIDSYDSYNKGQGDYADPHSLLEKNDQHNLLNIIISQLPEQQRRIIQLRDIQHIEYEEIAEILDMNVNAVRVSISRARNKIKEDLIKYEKYESHRDKIITR